MLIELEEGGKEIIPSPKVLKVIQDKQLNLLHLNPGAAGIEGFHQLRTLMRFEIKDAKMNNLEVIELGPRAKVKK